MNKELTELVFILDRSGSMHGLEKDTIGGFNSMIDKQRKEEGDCLVSAVLFNQRSDVLYDRVSLKEIREMTEKDYVPSGCTALIDALGGAIKHIRNVHKYIREEDIPAHTIFVITTDGLENASHHYSSDQVKRMVAEQKEKGWEFLFLGANIDAVETAKMYGIDKDRSVNYVPDSIGNAKNFVVLSETIAKFRAKGKIDADWSEEIEEDYKKRG
ncbi:MAG: VWA domain-containing protein [Erysipelotrichaceae bacterium]|nr:VWA domain-containing protein [Erysipelotrichaceae bacterium]